MVWLFVASTFGFNVDSLCFTFDRSWLSWFDAIDLGLACGVFCFKLDVALIRWGISLGTSLGILLLLEDVNSFDLSSIKFFFTVGLGGCVLFSIAALSVMAGFFSGFSIKMLLMGFTFIAAFLAIGINTSLGDVKCIASGVKTASSLCSCCCLWFVSGRLWGNGGLERCLADRLFLRSFNSYECEMSVIIYSIPRVVFSLRLLISIVLVGSYRSTLYLFFSRNWSFVVLMSLFYTAIKIVNYTTWFQKYAEIYRLFWFWCWIKGKEIFSLIITTRFKLYCHGVLFSFHFIGIVSFEYKKTFILIKKLECPYKNPKSRHYTSTGTPALSAISLKKRVEIRHSLLPSLMYFFDINYIILKAWYTLCIDWWYWSTPLPPSITLKIGTHRRKGRGQRHIAFSWFLRKLNVGLFIGLVSKFTFKDARLSLRTPILHLGVPSRGAYLLIRITTLLRQMPDKITPVSFVNWLGKNSCNHRFTCSQRKACTEFFHFDLHSDSSSSNWVSLFIKTEQLTKYYCNVFWHKSK